MARVFSKGFVLGVGYRQQSNLFTAVRQNAQTIVITYNEVV